MSGREESGVPDQRDLEHHVRDWYRQHEPPAGAVDRLWQRQPRVATVPIGAAGRAWLRRAAAMLVLAGIGGALTYRRSGRIAAKAPAAAMPMEARLVRFAVAVPPHDVRSVRLIGDFNGWDSTGVLLALNARSGQWEASIRLTPGVHYYTYLLDGARWFVDPTAPSAGDDLLGARNAIVVPGSE